MYSINVDQILGTVSINGTFSLTDNNNITPSFNQVGDEYTINFINMENIVKFKSFSFNTIGSKENKYLIARYRISRDTRKWTQWMDLDETIINFPPFDPSDKMFFDLKFIRSGSSSTGIIKLTDYVISGESSRNLSTGESSIKVIPNNPSIIKPPYIYKVFKISDIEIISNGDVTVMYRYSQDYGRTVTQWEPFTKENISTAKINPIRFFQIEYMVTSNSIVNLYDINIVGDFQNVTNDYTKTNLFGIRENCSCLILGIVNGNSLGDSNDPYDNSGSSGIGGSCGINGSSLPTLTGDLKKMLFNPYEQNKALDLLNKLSNDVNELFGHDVVYFLTDPDKNGIDYTFHEYQLLNYVCEGEMKLLVDGNNFPDNQISINQFDLSLFETFEVHITKDQFKTVFGVEKRPSKEDFMWFCSLNRMYQVEHASQFRNFNNSSVYYKVMLKKFNKKSNIAPVNKSIENKLNNLTKNTTIEDLFGLEIEDDKQSTANKPQFEILTKEPIRKDIIARINKDDIENSTQLVSRTNYGLDSVNYQSDAVVYQNMKSYFKVSDNIGYTCWFNINNYNDNEIYNLFNYHDGTSGIKIEINNNSFDVVINSTNYSSQMGNIIKENTWYCIVLNVESRQRKISKFLYQRDTDLEEDAKYTRTIKLRLLFDSITDFVIEEMDINDNAKLIGSDMKLTNIRLFNDVISEKVHNKILNQLIVTEDSKSLIFADNANKNLSLPNYS